MQRLVSLFVAAVAALALGTGVAHASGGNYSFSGGTHAEQTQVRSALNASSFNWDAVKNPVTINIARNIPTSYSLPGQIYLDANLLDSGKFSWGVVQMEYGQQVQFSLNEEQRVALVTALGAKEWCYENPSVPLADQGCERFAATLAWAYWPSTQNSMRPTGASDPSASMAPAAFRAMVVQMNRTGTDHVLQSAAPVAVAPVAATAGG
jgi:hypothetical protein